jgi:hypothetical protein
MGRPREGADSYPRLAPIIRAISRIIRWRVWANIRIGRGCMKGNFPVGYPTEKASTRQIK